MHKSLGGFFRDHFGSFLEAITNIYLFLPFFFSVEILLRTLFSPWKGLTDQTKTRGFSISAWGSHVFFNLISVWIGCTIRIVMLGVFFLVQSIYIIVIPVLLLGYLLLLPLWLLGYLIIPSPHQKKEHAKQRFLKTHVLDQKNASYAGQWFEHWYRYEHLHDRWWKLENLFQTLPLANDWAAGYTPTLDQYVIELSSSSYHHNRSHIVGRETEVQAIEQALLRSEEANVLIVGQDGVGKHTVLDQFSQRVLHGTCHPLLGHKRILKLNMEKVLAISRDPKEREVFFAKLLQEATRSGNVILLIDQIDRYLSSDGQNRVDMTATLAEYAHSNRLQLIGITNQHAYNTYIYPNQSLNHLFASVTISEITKQQALEVLFDYNRHFERRYRVTIPYETLTVIIEKSDFYITNIPFPTKAIQLLDSVCVYVTQTLNQKIVKPEHIDPVLSKQTHAPTSINQDMKTKLLTLEKRLTTEVLNQPEAVHEVAAALRRAFLLLGKRKKPLASFLFLGSTGVGKTQTAKAITHSFFESDDALLRFDMSLYQSQDDISKLIGSPQANDPGLLTSAVRSRPYGVLLLDEIEKANHDLLNIFLTMFDEGYLTDGYGNRLDCKNLIIIATSNAGADYLYQMQQQNVAISSNQLMNYLIEHQYFSPEFLNRFDGVIAFHPISEQSMLPIAKQMLAKIQQNVQELYQVKLVVSDQSLQYILQNHVDASFGARNLDRVLRDQIEDQVAQLILSGKAQPGSTITM